MPFWVYFRAVYRLGTVARKPATIGRCKELQRNYKEMQVSQKGSGDRRSSPAELQARILILLQLWPFLQFPFY